MLTAAIVFIVTYAIIGIQRIPRIHIDRPSGALLGAVGMVAFGVLSLQEAYSAIDLDTLSFLLGMMILIAYLELSGFFEVLERWIIGLARSTRMLLLLVVVSSGVLSALFMNDTICLLYTPVILRVTKRLSLNPVPYLIALATSANIGSVATIIGNPQNALIGLRSKIPFLEFSARLWPVAAVGLGLAFGLILWRYRAEIHGKPLVVPPRRQPPQLSYWLLVISLTAGGAMFVLLALDFHPPSVAMGLASLVILAGSRQPRRALERVDWTLLFLFAGLFVVMRGVEQAGLVQLLLGGVDFNLGQSLRTWLGFGASVIAVSNLVSNVPAVMLYAPLIQYQPSPESLWLLLAMASTLAGNLTLIGSVANLIVVEAARDEAQIGFFEYLKVGLPLTMVTVLVGTIMLILQ
ncbi:MAG: anion transporter [Acidobacteria bacterium]|nr:MAG: anion transporter [Acidobacteriota bacterium]